MFTIIIGIFILDSNRTYGDISDTKEIIIY